MNKNNYSYSSFLFLLSDFILLNASFYIINFLKRDMFRLSTSNVNLLILFNFIWILAALFTKKFNLNSYKAYLNGIFTLAKSLILMVYALSFVLVVFGFTQLSRIHIFGTCLMVFFLDVILFTICYISVGGKFVNYNELKRGVEVKQKISFFLLLSDFILLFISFSLMNYYKTSNFRISTEYEKIILIIVGVWIVISIITQKFNVRNFQNYFHALAAIIKAIILMGLAMSVIILAFRLFYFSRFQIFGTFLLLLIFETVFLYMYYIIKYGKEINGDIESVEMMQDYFEQKDLPIKEHLSDKESISSPSFMKVLMERFINAQPHFCEFLSKEIDLSKIKDTNIAIMNSPDIFCIQILANRSLQLLINLYKINNIRWINQYFLEVHEQLRNGGYLVGKVETISTHKKRFFRKYPKYFAEVLYFVHFIFFRVLPKLPQIRKIYFALTKGKNRMISRAEVLGRLKFCGFKIVAEEETKGILFFIAQKAKTSSLDNNPSYGPLIRLKRIGLNGQIIYVYKFRTMYPYSEYLQEYIYLIQKLDEGGKIKEDFRITDWGRFIRKYWIDELPMLYNWLKGDLKFFSVRPLSKQYLSLYGRYLYELRMKVKPGLIPPYYADLPKQIDEIIESEKRYILAFSEHPFKTQFIYFMKVLNNIIFRGARSG